MAKVTDYERVALVLSHHAVNSKFVTYPLQLFFRWLMDLLMTGARTGRRSRVLLSVAVSRLVTRRVFTERFHTRFSITSLLVKQKSVSFHGYRTLHAVKFTRSLLVAERG